VPQAASTDTSTSVARIYIFHRLHQEHRQVIHWAGADTAVQESATRTDVFAVFLKVLANPIAIDPMDRIDQLWQMRLDPAIFT
jgi:hypothetical protein